MDKKYSKKQLTSYFFWGCVTSIINFLIFIAASQLFRLSASLSNIAAWFISVIFSFTVNKIYVFKDTSRHSVGIAEEFFSFVLLRLFSGLLETALIYVFADVEEYNDMIVKLVGSVLVVILNYITSKWIVFSGKKKV